jgi:hypothetical protein
MDVEEIDDDQFEALLEQKRHNELLHELKVIGDKLSIETRNTAIEKSIGALSSRIESLVSVVASSVSAPKSVPVTTINQQEVVSSVTEMSQSVLAALTDLKQELAKTEEKKVWDVKVNRNKYSVMESLTFTQK